MSKKNTWLLDPDSIHNLPIWIIQKLLLLITYYKQVLLDPGQGTTFLLVMHFILSLKAECFSTDQSVVLRNGLRSTYLVPQGSISYRPHAHLSESEIVSSKIIESDLCCTYIYNNLAYLSTFCIIIVLWLYKKENNSYQTIFKKQEEIRFKLYIQSIRLYNLRIKIIQK